MPIPSLTARDTRVSCHVARAGQDFRRAAGLSGGGISRWPSRDAATPPTTAPHERDAVLLRARRVDGGLAFAFNPFAVGRKLAIRRINRLLSGVTEPSYTWAPRMPFPGADKQ